MNDDKPARPGIPGRGILLLNLGSPESPSVPDVRRYLNQFLMDERVLDSPWPIRAFVVKALILPSRPKESAEAYQSIWTEDGSPLIAISKRVQALLRESVDMPVSLGMRYGNPSTESAIRELADRGDVNEILLIPLYPHYAMSSYETAVVEAQRALAKIKPELKLTVLAPFYQDPLYIKAMAENAKPHLAEDYGHLLFSYHGIPERHVRKTDTTGSHCLQSEDCCNQPSAAHATCYRAQVFATTRAFAAELGLDESKYSVSFQSRLGRDPWLKPFTDFEFVRLAESGVKKLVVMSPAFVSDCLETLEELGIRGKEEFLGAGGEEYRVIPCMNEHATWIDALTNWSLQENIESFTALGRLPG